RTLRSRLSLLGLARRVRRAPPATPLRSGLPLRALARPPRRRRAAGRRRRDEGRAAPLRRHHARIEPDTLTQEAGADGRSRKQLKQKAAGHLRLGCLSVFLLTAYCPCRLPPALSRSWRRRAG